MSMRTRAWLPSLFLAALALSAPSVEAGQPNRAGLANCRRSAEQDPADREAWGCFYEHARATGEFAASAEALRASLAEVGELEPRAHGYALLALANLVAALDATAGIALYEQAVDALELGDDRLALTLTLLNLAHHQRVVGQSERSAEALRKAEQAAAAHGDPRWIATVAVERVRHMLRSSGDLGEARRVLASVEALLFPDGDYQAQVNWLNAAANVNRGLGRLDDARATHERLLALAEEAGDGYVEASTRYNRLVVMLEQERERGTVLPSDALVDEVERAIASAERGGNRAAAASLLCIQSDLLVARGQHDEAEASARRCADEARALGDPRLAADGILAVLDVVLAGRFEARVDEAEALLAEAQKIADASDDAHIRYAVSSMAAVLRWRTGPREQAIAASEAVLTALELLRVEQADPLSRAELLGAYARAYDRYVDQLLRAAKRDGDEGLIAAAFEVAERHRTRVLLESLRGAGVRAGAELLGQFSAVQRRLSEPAPSPETRAQLLAELDALERRELETLAESSTILPAEPVALARLQAQLGASEAVLIFQLARPRGFDPQRRGSWVMIVTRDSARAIELTEVDGLSARLDLFGALVEERSSSIDAAGARLWSVLLADALAGLGPEVDTLRLIVDGPLHHLPFAALRPEPGAPTLAERFATSVAPSAGVLLLWRSEASAGPASSAVLGLADPMTASEPWWMWTASDSRSELGPLPFARREAQLAADGPDDLAWTGADASEAALADADLERFAVLHIATHAVIDERHPSRSAIVLATGDDEHDGLLQAREIAGLDLRGKVVVLSACSSVGDRVIEGEGVMGLAHALFEAGARVVVGALWPLRDDEALELFARFYAELDAGSSVAAALATAQRERAAAGAEPAAWAGVVVLGDGALVPFPGGRRPATAVGPEPEEGSSTSRTSAWMTAGMTVGIIGLLALLGIVIVVRKSS